MKRSRIYPLAAPIAAVLLAATMAGSPAQAPLVQRLLTLRLTEVGGSPAVTTGEVGCTGATINGKQYPGARSFPVPERILDFPFQSVNPPVCTLVLSNLTDDEQLSVTINGVAVPRSGVSIVNAATKEIQATFSPIPLDGTTEVLIRTKPVVARGLKIAQIDASISTEMATQFSFTATVFDCVGVVWTDTYPGTGTENYRKFPGVTSAQCKVRFTPNPGQKVVTDFRTHTFFAAGRLVTPTFELDGSAVVNFPLAQVSGIRVISPAAPAAPLVAPVTTKPKASPLPPAVGDVVPEDVQDFNEGVCATLNPKTKKITVGACKGAKTAPNAATSGLVAGPVSLPENQPIADLLQRIRTSYSGALSDPVRANSLLSEVGLASSTQGIGAVAKELEKKSFYVFWEGGPERFEFIDSIVRPITSTSAEIRTCTRISALVRRVFSNDVENSEVTVSKSSILVKKNKSDWVATKISSLSTDSGAGSCATNVPLPTYQPFKPRTLPQSYLLPPKGKPVLDIAKKYLEASIEASRTKTNSTELFSGLVSSEDLSNLPPPKTYWVGGEADTVSLRERLHFISKSKASVEFCRVFAGETRDVVSDAIDPTSVGVKATSVRVTLALIGKQWLVVNESSDEPDFGYSNCWVGAILPPNLANPRVK
jgi:hypothetical protein